MLTKGFVVIVGVIVVVMAVGGSWTVDALTASHSAPTAVSTPVPGPAGAAGNQGVAGRAGRDGADGTDGTSGANGSNGASGKAGTNGKNGSDGSDGTDGTNGTDGPPGAPGAAASNPTFDATFAAGSLLTPTGGGVFDFPTSTPELPAGPTFVGFTVQMNSPVTIPVSCSLVGADGTVYESTTAQPIATGPSFTTFTVTAQAVHLANATALIIECTQVAPFPTIYTYQDLSIYGISFG